jgi:hypothetical protein
MNKPKSLHSNPDTLKNKSQLSPELQLNKLREQKSDSALNRHTGDQILRQKLVDPPIKPQIALSSPPTAKCFKF